MSYDTPTARPAEPVVVEKEVRAGGGLRLLQLLAGAAGAVLFVFGLVALFRVDFGAPLLDTTAAVADIGFSAISAIAAIVLGAATLVAVFADQDRGGTAVIGVITLLVGIAALVVEGRGTEQVEVDRRSALLFVGIGAAVFVLSLLPWWRRRRTTVVRAPQ